MKIKINIILVLLLSISAATFAQDKHPLLILTQKGVKEIRDNKTALPLFDSVLAQVKKEVDEDIASGIHVPVPKDMAGGYTHQRHKLNLFILQKAGNLYQITGDEKYAIFIRDVLMEYAELYPKLGKHPTNKSYATGKIFWQCLNDANWLVYVSQAYDCIYDWLEPKQVQYLNKTLFRPFADFISIENPQFFNRIHNHSTWGNAGVGMIGIVMNDKTLIQRALHGLDYDGIDQDLKDNDGGLIKLPKQKKAGFFAQLDHAFSPDGYYTEGPYYQRYAISPFILFAKALENNRPDIKIFEYRDGLLRKAVYSLLYQTNPQGEFFPINDAQKGMSFKSRELISAVNIVYDYCGNDPELLSVGQEQGWVELDASGFALAKGIQLGKAKPFNRKSIELRDGQNGDEGALGVLRAESKNGEICLAFKYTAQGLGHGHYDKLSYSLYDQTGEIVQDYGAARWVNIDQKGGGRYLKENKTWSKQTIGHNTLVVNNKSHFDGKFKKGNANHSDGFFFNIKNKDFQVASAKEENAYDGVKMHRTMALLNDDVFQNPLVIDILRVEADDFNQYDLPLWFQGHLLSANFDYKSNSKTLNLLGSGHGYQHVWKEAQGHSDDENAQITWFKTGQIYTMTAAVSNEDELIFGRLGANDPKFNLRHDPCLIIRKKGAKDAVFVSVIEAHGTYSPVDEVPHHPYGDIKEVKLLSNSASYTALQIVTHSGVSWTVVIANNDNSETASHQFKIGKKEISWTGNYYLKKN